MRFSSIYFLIALSVSVVYAAEEAPSMVRTFAGMTDSTEVAQRYPSVATVIEEASGYRCRFIFFADNRPIPLTATVAKDSDAASDDTAEDENSAADEAVVFKGQVRDPRGAAITWTAVLHRNIITGTYQQPGDKGTFRLVEQYP